MYIQSRRNLKTSSKLTSKTFHEVLLFVHEAGIPKYFQALKLELRFIKINKLNSLSKIIYLQHGIS